MSREIYSYVDCNGRCPVNQFLKSLEPKHRQKIQMLLVQLCNRPLQLPHVKAIRNGRYKGLYVLRSPMEPTVRVISYLPGEGSIVLLHGFVKASNWDKTVDRAMEMARIRRFALENNGARIQKFQSFC